MPEGSSHARKAARRQKRERQRQERYTDYRLERKKLDHHAESHLTSSQHTDPRFPPHTNPQFAKWIMEQNALHQSEKGSEIDALESTLSVSNIPERDLGAGSPVPSYTTTSSRPTRGSFDQHTYRTGSPPVRDTVGPPSRQNDRHSPFDLLESFEAHTMSDNGSKMSDYSADPDYNMPPKSAPPTSMHHPSYRDAYNGSLSSQAMLNSLTPYSQQQQPSQQAHLDKLSMDVMYHTQLSGASLSGISSVVSRLQRMKGNEPYLGRVHLKELDGDEIDMEKQRIKLMFYEKQNQERTLQEQGRTVSPQPDIATSATSRKVYPSSPIARDYHSPPNLKEGATNAAPVEKTHSPGKAKILRELETLEHMVLEQKRKYKEYRYARERESLNLKQAELKFREHELLGPGSISMSHSHHERWQKEQKRRLRELEQFRTEQKDKMQKIENDEHRAKLKLKALEAQITIMKEQLMSAEQSHSSSASFLDIHPTEAYHPDHLPSKLPPEQPRGTSLASAGAAGTSRYRNEHSTLRIDQEFRPVDAESVPEREWPKETSAPKPPGQFISMESIHSSSLVGSEVPEFSREIINTISESTNMTEPTQDELIPMKWPGPLKYAAAEDPYGTEIQSKFSFSDDEFFMDEEQSRRQQNDYDQPTNASSVKGLPEKDLPSVSYHHNYPPSMLPTGLPSSYGRQYYQHGTTKESAHAQDLALVDENEVEKASYREQSWGKQSAIHHQEKEKPQPHSSGRTDHHYSRSSRSRGHSRNTTHSTDNGSTINSTVASTTATSTRTNLEFLSGDSFKVSPTPDVVPMSATYSPTTVPTSSSPLASRHPTTERGSSPHSRTTDQPSTHSPSFPLPPPHSLNYNPFREHPPPHPHPHQMYAPSAAAAPTSFYDIPKKSSTKLLVSAATTTVYDQPRPSTSPPLPVHHAPQSPLAPYAVDANHSPYHKVPERVGIEQQQHQHQQQHQQQYQQQHHQQHPQQQYQQQNQQQHQQQYQQQNQQQQQQQQQPQLQQHHQGQQHYDVPKPASEKSRVGDREMRQGPLNPSPYPHQYHGLPTKPSGGRSYSRVRRDGIGYTDRAVRGQVPKPAQRVQRQQTEL